VHPQRWILVAAFVMAGVYYWLIGGFVGMATMRTELDGTVVAAPAEPGMAEATFAAGCFWSTEAFLDKIPGVVSTTSGYTGGRVPNPTYRQVTSGTTGHTEAVRVVFDPAVVSYDALLDHYWHNVDPFVSHRQFCDTGDDYRPVIFVHSEAQRVAAEASKARMRDRFRRAVLVEVTAAMPFYRAEEYHQDFYKRNSTQYSIYRSACGRDRRLAQIWGGT
jgi:peptide-methionine (S)-S-oxide reductase